jgi:hypothetical protein
MMIVLHSKHAYGPSMACYGDSFTVLYVDDVCTSKQTHLQAFTVFYRDNFTVLYVDDVCTSIETHMGRPWPVTGIALLYAECSMYKAFVRTLCVVVGVPVRLGCGDT